LLLHHGQKGGSLEEKRGRALKKLKKNLHSRKKKRKEAEDLAARREGGKEKARAKLQKRDDTGTALAAT